MPTIHLMRGLPGSGKSTLARELIDLSRGGIRRVNLDDIRTMLDGSAHRDDQQKSSRHETTALAIQDAAILETIGWGWDVVIDNTHLTHRLPNRYRRLIGGRARFEVHDLTHIPAAECIVRDARRPNPVGADVIRKMAGRIPHGRGITTEYMNDWPTFERYIPNPELPPAVICDLDGTLAHHVSRGPYEEERCDEDAVDDNVRQALVDAVNRGWAVLLLSGRHEEAKGVSIRELTQRWLEWNDVPYDHLRMRPADDQRPDYIVKAELFDQHVRPHYDVRLVLDDRDSVVDLWRRGLGLKCWQVAPGAF